MYRSSLPRFRNLFQTRTRRRNRDLSSSDRRSWECRSWYSSRFGVTVSSGTDSSIYVSERTDVPSFRNFDPLEGEASRRSNVSIAPEMQPHYLDHRSTKPTLAGGRTFFSTATNRANVLWVAEIEFLRSSNAPFEVSMRAKICLVPLAEGDA